MPLVVVLSHHKREITENHMDMLSTPYPKPATQLNNTPYPYTLPDQQIPVVNQADQTPTRGDSIGLSNDPVQATNSRYAVPTMTSGAMAGMSNVPTFSDEAGSVSSLLK